MRTKALHTILHPVALLFIFLLTAAPIHADTTVKIDGIYYNINSTERIAEVISSSSECTGSVVIPSIVSYNDVTYDVTSISDNAFENCIYITSVTIPNTVTSIGESAFCKCSCLTEITIPNSVTSIGSYAFDHCTGLTSLLIPNSVTYIGSAAFCYCYGLTSVVIPNSITSIGNSVFDCCSSLTEITIPSSVTSIGNSAFYGCTRLISIMIPSSVISIGSLAFDMCVGLTEVISLNPEPPTCSSNTFQEVNTSNCTLSVPAGSKEAYEVATGWKTFFYIEEMEATEDETGDTDEGIGEGDDEGNDEGIDEGNNESNDEGDDEGDNEGDNENNDDGDITPDLESCATPSIGYEDKHIVFSCETEGVTYHYTITCEDDCAETETTEGSVELSAVYDISVYATADGYASSETTTAKLYFFSSSEEDRDDTTIIVPTESIGVVMTTNWSSVTVNGLEDGKQVEAYNLSGIKLGATTSSYGSATVNVGNTTGVVILRLGNQAIKVKL